jgi:hypothetical protein
MRMIGSSVIFLPPIFLSFLLLCSFSCDSCLSWFLGIDTIRIARYDPAEIGFWSFG